MGRADPARAGLTVRCAIYTRKSSDEGLEQEFNSLDAQREACEAYIVSHNILEAQRGRSPLPHRNAARSLTWIKRRSMSQRRSCGSRR